MRSCSQRSTLDGVEILRDELTIHIILYGRPEECVSALWHNFGLVSHSISEYSFYLIYFFSLWRILLTNRFGWFIPHNKSLRAQQNKSMILLRVITYHLLWVFFSPWKLHFYPKQLHKWTTQIFVHMPLDKLDTYCWPYMWPKSVFRKRM